MCQFLPPTDTRRSHVRKGMRQLCELVGADYKRPHSVSHGDAVWALSSAGPATVLKAVSQNLMHKSLFTANDIYGMLTDSDTRDRVVSLARKKCADDDLSTLRKQVRRIAEKLGI